MERGRACQWACHWLAARSESVYLALNPQPLLAHVTLVILAVLCELVLRRGCRESCRPNRCEFGMLLRATVVYYANLDFTRKVRRARGACQ